MARGRSLERDKAFELWNQSRGTMKLKDIAAQLGVSDTQVRKWKNQDQWDSKVTLPNSNSNVTNGKSNVTFEAEEEFTGQCEAIGHKTGKRCRRKAIPGERFCSYHLDGHRENQCTAKSKQSGERCKKIAEPGKTKCKFHGGKSTGPPKGSQNGFIHGLFARTIPERYRDMLKQFEEAEPEEIIKQTLAISAYLIARSQEAKTVTDYQLEAVGKIASTMATLAKTLKDISEDNKEIDRLKVQKLKAEIAKAQGHGGDGDMGVQIIDDIDGGYEED